MNIDVVELKRKLASNPLNIIDIRSKYKFLSGTIKGAIHVDERELLYYHNQYLSQNKEYYLLCDHGFSSLKLSKMLNSLGYKTYSIRGGYDGYFLEK